MMNLDKILVEEVGQFGRYQVVTTAFLSVLVIFYTLASGEYDYTTAEIPHRCRIAECEGLSSDDSNPEFRPEWLLNAINGQSLNTFESCTRFAYSASLHTSNDSCPVEWFDRTREVNCDEYVYENRNSAVYAFNLACDDWRRTILDSYATVATAQALIIIGGLADRRGRRPLLIITVFIASCLGVGRSFITSYIWFLIVRILQIFFGCGTFIFCYILGVELTGPNYRVIVGAILSTMIPVGQIILNLMAWTVTSWRTLLLIIFTPQILVISYFWIIPESVRWLMYKEQYAQSMSILKKIAKVNLKELSAKSVFDLKSLPATTTSTNEKKPFFICVVFKTPGILSRIITAVLWCITISILQYTMDETTVDIVEHSYLNHIYITTLTIIGIWSAAFLLDRIGRKGVLIAGFMLCAACHFAIAFLSDGGSMMFTIVYLLSKYALGVVTSSVNLYIVELFPTERRSCIFSFCYMHSIVGSHLGGFITSLGPKSWMGLPSVLFSCLALISAVLVKFMPETRGIKLPDTMEEASQIGKEENVHTIQEA